MKAEQLDIFLALFPELLTVEQACDALDGIHKVTCAAWLEDRKLLGVDIRSDKANKPCLRIWKYSISHYLIQNNSRPCRLRVSEILTGRAKTTFQEAGAWLTCSTEHVSKLHADGLIAGPRYSKRHGRLLTASLHEFLERRWL